MPQITNFILPLLLFLSSFFAVFGRAGDPLPEGKLLSFEKVASYSREDLKAIYKKQKISRSIAPVKNGVDVYEVLYMTSNFNGSPLQASGIYFVPQGLQNLPLLVFHHGTEMKKERKIKMGGLQAVCIGFAADGYAAIMPDYLGLGRGEGMHLYHHVETEALASIDMVRALKEIDAKIGTSRNEQLFISGYSQGGHAAMALHKEIQERYKGEFTVTASAPLSGAYDLLGVQGEVMFKPYTHPGYLPFLLLSMNEVYGIFADLSQVFISPYDTLIPPYFDGNHSMREVNKVLPEIPVAIIKPTYVKEFLENKDHPLNQALRENSVANWKPETPVMMCYCKGDEQVSYKNALVARDKMKENGSQVVTTLKVGGDKFSHNSCALFAAIHAKFYFDSFRKGSKKGNKGPVFKRMLVSLGKAASKRKASKKEKST